MIVTVKIHDVYKTVAIELPSKFIDTDQEYLDVVKTLIRQKVWDEFSSYERMLHQNNINNMKPLAIIMIYSRNRDNYSD